MTMESIPKTFWHSLSVSVLILTVGFTWIAYRSGNVTLKYKDIEIITANATNEIEDARIALDKELESSREEIEQLRSQKAATEKTLSETSQKLEEIQSRLASATTKEAVKEVAASATAEITAIEEQFKVATPPVKVTTPRPSDFREVQMRINRLGDIQKQLQQRVSK